MNKFIDFALDHYRTMISILVFIIVMGAVSYIKIPKESFPDIEIPILSVQVSCRGISSEDSERLLVRPLEQKLRSISGVKEMNAIAFEGGASVILEFYPEKDLQIAKTEVKDQVDQTKAELPSDADDPVVREANISEVPVLLVKLSGNVPDRKLYRIAEDLKDEIEGKVSSVLRVDTVGTRKEIIEILVEPSKIQNYQLDITNILMMFQTNNKLISAGNVYNDIGKFTIKVPGILSTLQDILNCPLTTNGESAISVSDIATVKRAYEDPVGFARDRGRKAVVIEVVKRSGENLIETITNVRKIVEESKKNWTDEIKVDFAYDESKVVMDNLQELENTIILAVVLVVLIIAYSLGKSTAILVSISIPGAFLAGILYLYLCGYTLNIVVLFSLIFAVGMLVDGSIIVVEYADRKIDEGFSVYEAYRLAAQRMAWPVITSISTILVVFLPLLYWPDVIGKFMKFLPITLLATLTASIFMALIFVPCLAVVFLKNKSHAKTAPEENYDLPSTGFGSVYVRGLDWALHRPYKILLCVFALMIGSFAAFVKFGAGIEFFPSSEPSTAAIKIHARGSLSIYEQDKLIREVEKYVFPLKELASVYTRVGSSGSTNMMTAVKEGSRAQDEIGRILIEFTDWQKRRKAQKILEEIEGKLKHLSGIKIVIEEGHKGPPNTPIDIHLTGNNYNQLHKEMRKLRAYLDNLPELQTVQDTLPITNMEWRLEIDRGRAASFGASIVTIGGALQLITRGFKVGAFRPDDSKDEIDIMVRFPRDFRNIDELKSLTLQTASGAVPISNFVKYIPGLGVSELRKVDGSFCEKVTARLRPGYVSSAVLAKVQKWTDANLKNPEVKVVYQGAQRDQKKAGSFLGTAFLVAVFLIAIIMVTQFNSFFSTGVVLSAVLVSTIGVFIGLLVRGMPFGIVMGGIGVIALAGIIVSNNIILIDTYDHLADKIEDVRTRILVTGAQRLRPVLLTKITAISSLLPVMFAINVNLIHGKILLNSPTSDMWMQLSSNIVCGLLFGSVLTLIVTPCALMARGNKIARKKKQ